MTKKEEQALLIFEGKHLEENKYEDGEWKINMKMGNGKVGRIEN